MGEEEQALLNDEPVTETGRDRFRRRRLAERLAQLIEHATHRPDSTVFAVVGPWGSGKTSLLNFTRDALDDERIVAIDFNPWLVSSVDQLLGDFFAALLEHMPQGKRGRKARDALSQYGALMSPVLSAVPGGSAAGAATSTVAKMAEASLGTRRRQAEEALRKSGVAYVVVIDDIDRLLSDELLMLFKVIRLVGRLPNVHYLLAYDERSVLDALAPRTDGRRADRAAEYLEKIVQVPVKIPPLHESDVDDLFDATWSALRERSGAEVPEHELPRYREMYRRHLRPEIRQPREVVRLFAQIDHHWPLVKNETNIVDLLLIAFIGMRWPALHEALPAAGRDLFDVLSHHLRLPQTSQDERQQEWRAFMERCDVPLGQVDSAIGLLADLFPGVASAFGGDATDRTQLNARLRAGSPEYFERYFALGIPPGDVSDTEIAVAVAAMTEGDRDREAWLTDKLAERPRLVIAKMRRAAEQAGPATSHSPAMAHLIVKLVPFLRADGGGLFSPDTIAYRWLAETISDWSADARDTELPRLIALPGGLSAITRALEQSGRAVALDAVTREEVLTLLVEAARIEVTRAAGAPLLDPDLPWTLFYLADLGRSADVVPIVVEVLDRSAWTTLDFVACFVTMPNVIGTDVRRLGDLAVDQLAVLLPLEEAVQVLSPQLDDARGRPQPDLYDISHASRVSIALAQLRALRETPPHDLPHLSTSSISRCGPAEYATWPGRQSELLLRAVAAIDADEDPPGESRTASLRRIEDQVIQAVSLDGLTQWLTETAAAWGSAGTTGWTLRGDSTGMFLRLAFAPSYADEGQPVAAQLTVGTNEDDPHLEDRRRLTITVDVGINLDGLDEPRRTASRPGATLSPEPARLSLREAVTYLEAALAGAVRLVPEVSGLLGNSAAPTVAGLWVSLNGTELQRAFELSDLKRLDGGVTLSEGRRITMWPIRRLLSSDPCRTWALATIGSMLEQAGYRNFADQLT